MFLLSVVLCGCLCVTGSFLGPGTGFVPPTVCFSPIFHLHASYTKKMCGDKPGGHQSELLSGGDGAQISAPKLAHFSIQGLTKFKIYR